MKKLLLILGLVLLGIFYSPPQEIIVLAGQSNALGWESDAQNFFREGGDNFLPFFAVEPEFSSSQRWGALAPTIGRFPAGHFGPEVALARLKKVGIFKFAQGSTSLAENWRGPGEGGLYDQMIEIIRKACRGKKIIALVWLQGESDARTSELAEGYKTRLKRILDHFREFAGNPDLPVILGVDELHPWMSQNPQVASAQKELGGFVSVIGLPRRNDHLTAEGVLEHGRRIYEAMVRYGNP